MLYCFEENWCTTVLRKRKPVLDTVLKRTGALLFAGEGNQCSSVLKRTGALLFSGEGNRCSTFFKRTDRALLFSGERNR